MNAVNTLAKYLVVFVSVFIAFCCNRNLAEELTFELPDNEKMCFHEIIEENTKCILEYQVITGGNYDVDVELFSPGGVSLYKEVKRQYDSHSWTADKKGEYKFCFSNEFSTFTHKLVYFDFRAGEEDALKEAFADLPSQHRALTQMESSSKIVHENLKSIIDYQTHHRLREAQGEEFAELLNERVHIWSAGQALIILLVGAGQILILRSFFTDKR